MRALFHKELIVVIGIVFVLISGCSEPESMNVKMSRIVAAENMELKEELRQQDWEIKSLKEQHEQQINNLEDTVAGLKEQVKALAEKSKQNVRDQVEGVLDVVVEQNAQLKAMNERLKEEIEQLKKQLDNPYMPKEDKEPLENVLK